MKYQPYSGKFEGGGSEEVVYLFLSLPLLGIAVRQVKTYLRNRGEVDPDLVRLGELTYRDHQKFDRKRWKFSWRLPVLKVLDYISPVPREES